MSQTAVSKRRKRRKRSRSELPPHVRARASSVGCKIRTESGRVAVIMNAYLPRGRASLDDMQCPRCHHLYSELAERPSAICSECATESLMDRVAHIHAEYGVMLDTGVTDWEGIRFENVKRLKAYTGHKNNPGYSRR